MEVGVGGISTLRRVKCASRNSGGGDHWEIKVGFGFPSDPCCCSLRKCFLKLISGSAGRLVERLSQSVSQSVSHFPALIRPCACILPVEARR